MNEARRRAKARFARLYVFLAFAYGLLIPATVALFLFNRLPISRNLEAFAAAFSDLVSPVFSVLAFGGLVFTAFMQYQELSLQREELQETREELKRTADAQSEQVKIAQLSARLAAETALLNHYEVLASRLPTTLAGNPTEEMLEGLRQEKDRVYQMRRVLHDEIFSLRNELRAVVHHVEIDATLPAVTGSVAVEQSSPGL